MKRFLLPLASMALVIPAYALDGEGTKDNPFQITKLEDFAEIPECPVGSYYSLENDIDAKDINYVAPYTQAAYGTLHLDGKYHVIRNLKVTTGYSSLLGSFDGSVKNLGLEDIEIASGAWDPAGAIAAYAGITEPALIENCYTTGKVDGYYSGGIVGGTKAGITINNCYSIVDCNSSNGFAGGILATVNYIEGQTNTANISNCFAAGAITGNVMAGGIVGGNQQSGHKESKEVVNLNNVVAWNPSVTCKIAGIFVGIGGVEAELNTENAYYWEYLMVNSEEQTGGKTGDELDEFVTTWSAFTIDDAYNLPVLKWQVGELPSTGIAEIAAEENAPAEYFNLQGVRVTNPDNGIYIVRRGAKVTKEIVR